MAFRLTRREITGGLCALLPFVVSFADRSVRTENGVTTVLYSYDYADVILGAAAVIIGVLGLLRLRQDIGNQAPLPHIVILAAIIALGAYQAMSGASLI